MISIVSRKDKRKKRAKHVRRFVNGTAERPRMCVRVSNRWIYVQFVDDVEAKVLGTVSSMKKGATTAKKVADAQALGAKAAEVAKAKGFVAVVFDRGGYKFHGRLKALADAARGAGLRF